IPRGAPDRAVATGFLLVPNVFALYGLEDARHYEAMTLGLLRETYPLWCVDQPVWYNRVDDLSRPFLAFLNVRYAVVPEVSPPVPGWKRLGVGSGVRVIENPDALPRAFVPRSLRFEADGGRRIQLLNEIQDFGREGIVGEKGPSGRSENGEAEVSIGAYTGQEMSLRIGARQAAIVGTSIPAWPGWKLELDGRRAPLLSYNHAFLAFRVPPGTHEARLFYLPDGFLYGASISLATLALCGVLLVVRDRKRRDREPSARGRGADA
ncbi:MAG: YfhO family protein, partial [Syntrophomonadaceae bacterium]